MKVLLCNGSPRKQGFTTQMAEHVLQAMHASRVDIYNAYAEPVTPCKDCRYCWKKRACSIQDNMQQMYQKIDEADVIIFASPVYFHSITGPLKSFIDRLQVYWARVKRGEVETGYTKIGAILLCGGAPEFPKQFLGAEIVLGNVLGDLHARQVGEVTISNTDKLVFKEQFPTLKQLDELAREIEKEYEQMRSL